MTPEGKVKLAVRNYLRSIQAYYFMPVQMGMGEAALDFIVCHEGRFFEIETKKDEKSKPTPRQLMTARLVTEAGGVPLLVRTPDALQVKALLDPYFFPARYFDPAEREVLNGLISPYQFQGQDNIAPFNPHALVQRKEETGSIRAGSWNFIGD